MADPWHDDLARLRAERDRLLTELRRRGVVLSDLPALTRTTIQQRLEAWRAALALRQHEARGQQREEAG